MTYKRVILTAGFAMFSMFFGSGNLVFPLLIGTQTLDVSTYSTLGLILTAVIVPFLGLFGMILYNGNTRDYFDKLGRIPSFLLILAMLSLMGPFGVVPRCITVAYGGLNVLYPTLPFDWFSAGFCALITLLIWKSNRVVDVIGLLLTPFKLGGLMLLMIVGLYYAPDIQKTTLSTSESFLTGLYLGYQTMDLMAAFFFSATTVAYLRQNLHPEHGGQVLFKISLQSLIIGALLLAVAYIGFVKLGAHYATQLVGVQPESLLVVIAEKTMGIYALPIVGYTMAIACLATAVILTILFVDFLFSDILKGKLNEKVCIFITIGATYAMSLLGFSKICSVLGQILEVAYPALIGLAIGNILSQISRIDMAKILFWGILLLNIIYKLINQQ
ncbi:MAG: branched-chain amino acid transport system II carrier protein [Candidatus Paracaedibacteraceae bacterium]|nr:branched-chain amino acid transport system II carrier protein [Candidatus Paracaedibacteraceae bacterium]